VFLETIVSLSVFRRKKKNLSKAGLLLK